MESTTLGREASTVPAGISVDRIEARGAGGGNGSTNSFGGDGSVAIEW